MSDAGDSRLALKDSLSRLSGLRRDYGIYLWALLIFATSRMVVFIGVNFGTLLVRDPDPTKWEAGPYWYHRLLRWDSGWYAAIVRDGYQYSDDPTVMASVNFFPLYPLLSAIAKELLGTREWGALLVVANASSLLAIVLLTKFLRDELDEESALLSLTLFCFFPSSLFLSAGYSESLCLVFVLLALMLLSRQQFVLAAMMAGVSLAARSTCIVLAPVILLEIWRHNRLPLPRLLAKLALCGVLAISGLLVYMVYLQVKFGHPMAFAVSQDAFTHERPHLRPNEIAALELFRMGHLLPGPGNRLVLAIATGAVALRARSDIAAVSDVRPGQRVHRQVPADVCSRLHHAGRPVQREAVAYCCVDRTLGRAVVAQDGAIFAVGLGRLKASCATLRNPNQVNWFLTASANEAKR